MTIPPVTDLAPAEAKLQAERWQLERERLQFERDRAQNGFLQNNWQAIITVVISFAAAVVSIGQLYSSVSAQRHEQVIKKVQTLGEFLPQLIDVQTREAALLIMDQSKLLDEGEIEALAEALNSKSTLEKLRTRGTPQEQQHAAELANRLDERMDQLVAKMFSPDKAIRVGATTSLIHDWVSEPSLVPRVLKYGAENPNNVYGVWDTLILLQSMNPQLLRPYQDDIREFAEAAKKNGPKTTEQSQTLLEKLKYSK